MRRLIHAMLGITLVMAICFARQADAQVTLKHKIPDGLVLTAVSKIETKQVLTIAGQPLETASTQTRTVETKNGRRAADGTIRVETAVKGIQASLSLPGGVELDFDSEKPDVPPAGTQYDILLELLKASAKASFTMVHDKDNRVISVEGSEKALEAFDENTKKLVEKQFDEEYLKDQANEQIDLLPSTPVSVGDTWMRDSELRLESGQSLEFKAEYEYRGTKKNARGEEVDRIGVKIKEVSYSVDDGAPFQVTDSELEVAESDGELLFDRQGGQIMEQQTLIRITGNMTFVANGMELPARLDLSMKNVMTRK